MLGDTDTGGEPSTVPQRRMIMKSRLSLLFAVTFVLAACGDDPAPPGSDVDPVEEPVATDGLNGSWWLVDGPVGPIPGHDVTVTFDGNEISGTAACNGYGGTVDLADGAITVGELNWTEMGCEPEVQALEQTFLQSLATIDTYRFDGDLLVLMAPDAEWTFEPSAPAPPAELVGTTWRLDTVIAGDSASNSPDMDSAFIEFHDDGTLVGSTGCRRLEGEWANQGATIQIPFLSAIDDPTAGACEPDVEVLDGDIIAVAGSGPTVEVDGSRLTMTAPGGDGLSFFAEPTGDSP